MAARPGQQPPKRAVLVALMVDGGVLHAAWWYCTVRLLHRQKLFCPFGGSGRLEAQDCSGMGRAAFKNYDRQRKRAHVAGLRKAGLKSGGKVRQADSDRTGLASTLCSAARSFD